MINISNVQEIKAVLKLSCELWLIILDLKTEYGCLLVEKVRCFLKFSKIPISDD